MNSMDPPPAPEPERPQKSNHNQPTPNVSGAVEAIRSEIVHQAQARPYVTVLAAAATGYVLGRGTPKWMSNLAWEAARRAIVSRVVASLANT